MTAKRVAIRTMGLTKRYAVGGGEKVALPEVSLTIPAGEFWIVSGPSGSGKTTLLALLGGMIAPTSGEVWLQEQCFTHLRDHHRARARRELVGMVFQELALVAGMSLVENLYLPLVPVGGPGDRDRARAERLLERFGMTGHAETPVERLSAGERQRVAIMRAVLVDVPILLLDEPTAALDGDNVEALLDIVLQLRGEGRTLVATTHDQRLVGHSEVDGVVRLGGGGGDGVKGGLS